MLVLASRRPSWRPLVVFLIVLSGLIAATAGAWATVPGFSDRVKNIQLAYRPPGGDYYLAHDRGGHIDHYVHYFGTEPEALSALRAADVLFLGNSRLMFALRSRIAAPWFAERGVSYYAMGFGFREGDGFPLAIIRKFDLRPRLVVVNEDAFFGEGLSRWAQQVVRDTPFAARKFQWEGEIGHEVRRVVHQVVPNWLDLYGRPGFLFGREFIAYRSRLDGTWAVSPWPDGQQAIGPTRLDVAIGPRVRDAALQFEAEVTSRGGRLVLMYVPTPTPTGDWAETVARLLDVPLVTPDIEGLTSHDGSHLTERSAVRWSQRFLAALEPHLPR